MKVTKSTIIRTAILILALTNQMLSNFGYDIINIDDETLKMLINTGFTIVASLIAWWKNNSFTKEAIKADKSMRYEKSKKKRF